MNDARCPKVSIIIPTLNEAGNIDPLLKRISSVIETARLEAEVLIVDGGSTDGTQAEVQPWIDRRSIRLILSEAKLGLAGDVVAAARSARGDFVVVLDADLSHPPDAIPQLVQPLLDGTHDMALGSRYIKGGSMLDWPWSRWLVSRVATMLVGPLARVKDPLSGFFAVRRHLLLDLVRQLSGFKIALEILARGGDRLRVIELPIIFQNRATGRSKFGIRQIVIFLKQLAVLAASILPIEQCRYLAKIASMALLIDFLLFNLLLAAHTNPILCQGASFLAAAVFAGGLAARRNFSPLGLTNGASLGWLLWRMAPAFLLILLLRSALFQLFTEHLRWLPQGAMIVAALSGTALLLLGAILFAVFNTRTRNVSITSWQSIAIVMVGYTLLFKLVFMGLINIIPEEAYYWNYAQHLDLSYLDHPPMVAWLIWLSTTILGHSEFAIRLPAFIASIIAAVFMFRLTENICDRSAAFRGVLLFAVLPIFFGASFFMTPDAALYAAWAACLYFLERALLAGKQRAWWGVGVAIGLGMLAKYSIALLGLATLTFLVIDRLSRKWLLRPQPYIAALVGAMLFSPVLIWNMRNNWASFMFQGASRWKGNDDFSVHYVILSVLLVLTPVGLLALGRLLLPERLTAMTNFHGSGSAQQQRQRLWWLNFTLVPLSIFLVNSVNNDFKLHWTGPVFLAVMPWLAQDMVPQIGAASGPWVRLLRRAWLPTIIALLVSYGAVFNYFTLGSPGSPMLATRAFGPWRLLAQRVDEIEKRLANETGSQPIRVGMDKYRISSETSFYDSAGGDAPRHTGGPHFFGGRSLMWAYWLPQSAAVGRNFLLIDFERKRLLDPALSKYFDKTGAVYPETLEQNGRVVGSFYWRVGYGYRNP
jgi:dolichol-phosphate mannosyltransferase